jgi:hypothetical protein
VGPAKVAMRPADALFRPQTSPLYCPLHLHTRSEEALIRPNADRLL